MAPTEEINSIIEDLPWKAN